MRKILFQVHLWLGLILSLPFLLLGVTGALLVFDQDVIAKMNEKPALTVTAGQLGSLDALAAAALASAPDLRVATITAPKYAGAPAEVRLAKKGPAPRRPGGGVQAVVEVDPVSFAVLRTDKPQTNMLTPIHLFHENFALGPVGRQIVAWSGVGMFLMGLSGLWLWWPRGGQWARAFTIRKGARGYLFNRDLHGAAGVWLWLVFIVVTATGAFIGFPQLRGLSGEQRERPAAIARSEASGSAISLDAALGAARKAAPDGKILSVTPAATPSDPIRLTLTPPGWREGAPTINVTIAAASGDVISVRDPRGLSGMQAFATWARPLHEGAGLGPIYKTLVFLSGILPVVFVITGVLMYLQKRKNRAAAAQ